MRGARELRAGERRRLAHLLRKGPTRMGRLVEEFGHADIVQGMKCLSDEGTAVQTARVWNAKGGWQSVFWIEPEARTKAKMWADVPEGEVL